MQEVVYIISDLSGSHAEMGKVFLMRNLLRFVSQLPVIHEGKYTDIEFKFFNWKSEISETMAAPQYELPYIEPEGQTDLGVLKAFIERYTIKEAVTRVLLLSDGYYTTADIKEFDAWKKTQLALMITPVAIGADADDSCLKKLTVKSRVYQPEDIGLAVDAMVFGWKAKTGTLAPETIADIQIQDAASEEAIGE